MKDKNQGYKMIKYLLVLVIALFNVGCVTKQSVVNDKETVHIDNAKNETVHIDNVKNETLKVAVEHVDFLDENALHDAVRANDLMLVKFLINQGVIKNQRDQYGFTPLHIAVRLHNLEIVKYLVEEGVDINTLDVYKDTPLLDSTRNNDTGISRILICNGAYRNVVDMHSMSTLNNSAKNKNQYITELLRTNNLKDECLKEPLEENENEVVEEEVTEEEEVVEQEEATIEDEVIEEEVIEEEEITTEEAIVEEEPIVTIGLYEALIKEFKNDFEPWNANLDEESLVFTFQKPSLLFSKGKQNLKSKFKNILNDFLPRYAKILDEYKDEIDKVTIQGHTSSEYSSVNSVEEKYKLNQILSDKRANAVYDYSKSIISNDIDDTLSWLNTLFTPIGKSSSSLITNEDGTENKELSRRVEFDISTKNINELN